MNGKLKFKMVWQYNDNCRGFCLNWRKRSGFYFEYIDLVLCLVNS